MNKNPLFETLVILAFLAVALLLISFVTHSEPSGAVLSPGNATSTASTTASSTANAPSLEAKFVSEDFNTYTNSKLGFSFQYPKEYGNLRLKESTSAYASATTTLYFESQFGEFNKVGVYLYTKGYDSGTEMTKEPVCPDIVNRHECERRVNARGEAYYKVDFWIHEDKSTRYEFPLNREQSLVFYDSELIRNIILDSVTVEAQLDFLNTSSNPKVEIVSVKAEKPFEIVANYEFLPERASAFALCERNNGCTEIVSSFTVQEEGGTHVISANKSLSEGTYYLILIGDSFTDQIVFSTRVEVK